MSTLDSLYAAHVEERKRTTEKALSETKYERLLLHSGQPFTYFADDNDAPFHPTPHFAHWAPVEGPNHILEFVPGKKPRLVRVMPRDFWYEAPAPAPDFVRTVIDVTDVETPEAAWKEIGSNGRRTVFVGGSPDDARANALKDDAINPGALVARLDWERSYKSDYEVQCLADATAKAARGFRAAEAAFRGGASEMEIHHAYLTAIGDVEEHLPYTSIVGLNERAATLHYHGKRGKEAAPGDVLLIDAGAMVRGYGSDITRTYVTEKAEPLFARLREGMESIQQQIARSARPGTPYLEMHLWAHRLIGELLALSGILKVSGEQGVEKGLTRPFLPHGLGHFLGIQVHDVAGRQTSREGGTTPPPEAHPYLRTTRTIEERQVFTIEPGLYFIPMLLEPFREGEHRSAFDWGLIDRLTKCGGIRIEDDVFVGADENRNLTREALPS